MSLRISVALRGSSIKVGPMIDLENHMAKSRLRNQLFSNELKAQ